MRRFPLFPVFLLLAVALLAAGCSSDPTQPPTGLSQGVSHPGVQLSADPAEIVIDTTDPDAPTDPDTEERIGTTTLTAMVTDAAGVGVPDVEVLFESDAGALDSAGQPVVTDMDGNAFDTLTVVESDSSPVTVTATSGERVGTLAISIRLILPNEPPVADAGEDQSIECSSPSGNPVTLDGSGSSDADSSEGTHDDIVSFEWFVDFDGPDEMLLGEGETLDVSLPPGLTVVTLRVTDGDGETATDEVEIDVVDSTLPEVTVTTDPDMLWPPNHRLVPVVVSVDVVDACSVAPTILLVSATSNEPDNGMGDGDTADDIQGAGMGAEDYDLWLRAERAGGGSGRVYTLTYEVTDDAGNGPVTATAEVLVPHDQGGY